MAILIKSTGNSKSPLIFFVLINSIVGSKIHSIRRVRNHQIKLSKLRHDFTAIPVIYYDSIILIIRLQLRNSFWWARAHFFFFFLAAISITGTISEHRKTSHRQILFMVAVGWLFWTKALNSALLLKVRLGCKIKNPSGKSDSLRGGHVDCWVIPA